MNNSFNWCFTLNNPTDTQLPRLWDCKYAVWQLEQGSTPHLQGYVQLVKRARLSAMKKINAEAHWEPRKGTHEQAKQYCTKEETRVEGPWEYGEPTVTSGQRNDIKAAMKRTLEADEVQVADEHPEVWCKYYRALERYKRIKTQNRDFKTEVYIIYGEPGSGKSSYCMKQDPNAYWKPKGPWWDGYSGQHTVVIDEFYGWLPYDFLNRLLDRYPLIVETKGGAVNFVSKVIYITSNKHPIEWYQQGDTAYKALSRRVTKLLYKESLDTEFIEEPMYKPPFIKPQ